MEMKEMTNEMKKIRKEPRGFKEEIKYLKTANKIRNGGIQ
jgi:hypothetical protein